MAILWPLWLHCGGLSAPLFFFQCSVVESSWSSRICQIAKGVIIFTERGDRLFVLASGQFFSGSPLCLREKNWYPLFLRKKILVPPLCDRILVPSSWIPIKLWSPPLWVSEKNGLPLRLPKNSDPSPPQTDAPLYHAYAGISRSNENLSCLYSLPHQRSRV